jgi:hypothetical protein
MPNTAPGAETLTGGVKEDAKPAVHARRGARAWRWAGPAVFLLIVVVLFDAYLHLSKTYPENSDEANILLMANDMLHGNVLLSGWHVSDVPFITTELPQITLLVWMFGLRLNTAHIAAAVTYTLVVAVAMLLAKGKADGWKAVARMGLALGIMLAPQSGVGVFVLIFSVGHIGTALPVMLTWLVIDRCGRKWWVPLLVALLLGWALTADPLVLVVAVFPLLAVCLVRLVSGVVAGARDGGWAGIRAATFDRWFEAWIAAGAGIGYLIAWGAGQLITSNGGYGQQPVPYQFDWPKLFMQSQIVVHGLLEMFGAYFPSWGDSFIPLETPHPAIGGLDQAIALTHLVAVVFAVWGMCAIARRFFFRDADFVSQLLLAGIVANIAAYVPSTLAHHTALNVREIAPVLPFAAVLAGRMIGDRLVGGPVAVIKLPRLRGSARGASAAVAEQAAGPGAPVGGPGAPAGKARRPRSGSSRSLRIRLVAAPLVVLFGWYSYGLFREADAPAAPLPFTQVASFLESAGLTYGLGGYWQASLITLETGGAVTIRAVTPACLQPYPWESKTDWYDGTQHVANFILLSNVDGYFNKFAVSGAALTTLNAWDGYLGGYPHYPFALAIGGYTLQPVPVKEKNGQVVIRDVPIYDYTARVYPKNLLTQLPPLEAALTAPPAWLQKLLKANGNTVSAC